jgi:hypothetical protein
VKFEIMEQPGADRSPPNASASNPTLKREDTTDPLVGLRAGTARLADEVRAEALHISECVAEMTDLAAQAARARLAPPGDGPAPRPPANFRAARFGSAPNG